MNNEEPARGCAFGLLLGMFLWIVIFIAGAVAIAILARVT